MQKVFSRKIYNWSEYYAPIEMGGKEANPTTRIPNSYPCPRHKNHPWRYLGNQEPREVSQIGWCRNNRKIFLNKFWKTNVKQNYQMKKIQTHFVLIFLDFFEINFGFLCVFWISLLIFFGWFSFGILTIHKLTHYPITAPLHGSHTKRVLQVWIT